MDYVIGGVTTLAFVGVVNLVFGRRDPDTITDELARRYQRALPLASRFGVLFGLMLVAVGLAAIVTG